jgi:hypothetical protein
MKKPPATRITLAEETCTYESMLKRLENPVFITFYISQL